MFDPIKNKLKSIGKLKVRDLFRELFLDKEFTDLIIKLNTQDQLFDKGINSDDQLLSKIDKSPSPSRGQSQGGVYSVNTEQGIYGVYEGKISLGLPVDRVTLYQYGDFYKSFKTVWQNGGNGTIIIKANTIKDGIDLLDRWGADILGLDEQNLGVLRDFARTKLKEIVLVKLKQAA